MRLAYLGRAGAQACLQGPKKGLGLEFVFRAFEYCTFERRHQNPLYAEIMPYFFLYYVMY
jgi:hypothetical protein